MSPQATPLYIIFSRFPRPGQSKTRLISALGSQGAALLQQKMTEQLLVAAKDLQQRVAGLQLELHMADANQEEMARWLDCPWQAQQGNDLGERMANSFHASFSRGFQPIMLSGADCPALNSAILGQALQALHNHDAVLGPSLDGGYYLIGLQQPQPQLFQDISWGEAEVARQTQERLAASGLRYQLLPELPDIDRPSDLCHLPASLRSQLGAGP